MMRRFRYRRHLSRNQKFAGPAVAAALLLAVAHSHPGAAPAAPATAQLADGRASGSENAFARTVLTDLGAPATQAGVTSLTSWFPHEFPSWPPLAANNPMATTMPAAGSTTYNSAGVQNYPSASEGAQAIALTLDNGHYPGIVAALRSGRGLCGDPSLAAEFLTWSGNGYSGVC